MGLINAVRQARADKEINKEIYLQGERGRVRSNRKIYGGDSARYTESCNARERELTKQIKALHAKNPCGRPTCGTCGT